MYKAMITTKIVELLEQRGKSLYWLSKETGTAYSTMHKLGSSTTDSISFRVLDRLCDVLECTPGDILVKADNKKNKGAKK